MAAFIKNSQEVWAYDIIIMILYANNCKCNQVYDIIINIINIDNIV